MYANDFNGEIVINTESQVVEFIRNRPAFNANQFIFTFEESGIPQLCAFVRDDYCVLYFLDSEQKGTFASYGDDNIRDETVTFYENVHGAEVVLASTMVITVKQMTDACTEFFKMKTRPTCIKWMEL
ncbi:Imm1 family immunity protein [Paenibacillus taichungensis]|uniref:Imm1 family immunity protein n=1 Tax=Paenibacillus taichungensis TaxID=484184 RepID=UPI0035D9D5ED